ncbi:hypothetical protein BOTBODRAFT_478964 [Botryobasidium botryosum FD-172 SS1]|uniref:Uncharacterized protein n=1 Tax=Botryobasidium botryosum (strain FD-172 SS1) TaxID=930990 RepID=A0A067MT65_BOTB1|nr:hypothetical protein BOTBODRAFT_478964 [Botryobasidium botryosum FD-172 SS1]
MTTHSVSPRAFQLLPLSVSRTRTHPVPLLASSPGVNCQLPNKSPFCVSHHLWIRLGYIYASRQDSCHSCCQLRRLTLSHTLCPDSSDRSFFSTIPFRDLTPHTKILQGNIDHNFTCTPRDASSCLIMRETVMMDR